jgi:hypothetical protein
MLRSTLKRDPDYLQFRPYRAIVATPKKRAAPVAGGKSNLVHFPLSSVPKPQFRSRLLYAALAVGVIGIGLLWRSPFISLPPFLTKYGGSAWWSLLVFLGCGFAWSRAKTSTVALFALVIAFAVEFSQLYHAPWIDQIRAIRLGALILGNTFSWADLVAYAVGIFIGAILESILRKRAASLV